MKMISLLLVAICLAASHISSASSISVSPAEDTSCPATSCPPWFKHNATTCECECNENDFKGIVNCDNSRRVALVLDCYCATVTIDSNGTLHTKVGSCFYNCEKSALKDILYHEITANNSVCDEFNRTGTFCGECMDGYYPFAYSFSMTCVKCNNHRANWIYFALLATVPSTFLFILSLVLKLNITSSYLHSFIFFSQGISFPANMRIILRAVSTISWPGAELSAKILASIYGFCILDFFRPLLPNLCLKLTTLQVLSLDYIVAAYPLVLTALLYMIVILYHHNFRVVVCLTYPIRKLFSFSQRNWNIRNSVTQTYANFFLLSYAKFLSASFDLLMPTYIHDPDHPDEHNLASYYAGNLAYFKTPEHLHLALTALVILTVFVVLPTLVLLLYPFRFSQTVLRKLRLNDTILDQFVKPFYKCYRDGTEGTRYDCRWFAALFLVLRIMLPLLYSFTLGSVFLPLAVIIIFIFVMILITVKPYSNAYSHFIKFDVTFLLLLALFYLAMISVDVSSIKDHRLVNTSYCLAIIFGVVPLLYAGSLTVYWVYSNCKEYNYRPQLLRRVQDEGDSSMEGEEPDRLLHPTEYLNNASIKASSSVRSLSKETY